MKNVARKFLQSGDVGTEDPEVLAEVCNQAIRLETQRSTKSAIKLARTFVKQARPHGGLLLTTALRALGWALHVSGKYTQAEQSYLKARDLARSDPLVRGRIDRILIDINMYLGRFDEARRRWRLALSTFSKMGAYSELAKTRVNYANLLHRQDRHKEAFAQYQLARRYFESSDDQLTLALCYYNLANTLVQLFDFTQAESLYKQAEAKFTVLGHDLYANESRYGVAWLRMLEGNYHVALQALAECEEGYRRGSQPRGVILCKLDRAEAFLGLNLFTDARRAAEQAEKAARKLGLHYESAKGALFCAKASLGVGEVKQARTALRRAAIDFRQEKNQAFLGAVEFTETQIDERGRNSVAVLKAARERFARAQLPLWEAYCDLQLLSSQANGKSVLRRLSRNPAVESVPHLYAQWQTVLGNKLEESGRTVEAMRCWSAAADRLDSVRAKLPPVELRSAYLRNRTDPYERLVQANLEIDGARAAAWSERFKTAGRWAATGTESERRDGRQRAEASLAKLARQVTVLSQQIGAVSRRRSTAMAAENKALNMLRKQVTLNLALLEKSSQGRVDRIDTVLEEIQATSCRQPIVQFHQDRNDLIAFVHRDKTTRFHRYRDGLKIAREFIGCWQILLSRALLSGDHSSRTDLTEEQQLYSDIGDWLWSPLEISRKDRNVLILPEGRISNLPWNAVIVEKEPLVVRHRLIISPSLSHHIQARGIRVRSKRIEVFVGNRVGLSRTDKELRGFLSSRDPHVKIHHPCIRADWPEQSQAQLWHFTGHADFRNDNPFYSSLSLADGPLFAADLRLKRNRVKLVTLAACRTGGQTFVPGEESIGMVRSFLEMGARSVIASHWSVSDRSTALWMAEFYAAYLKGVRIEKAMMKASLNVKNRYPSAYHWAAFSLFGTS